MDLKERKENVCLGKKNSLKKEESLITHTHRIRYRFFVSQDPHLFLYTAKDQVEEKKNEFVCFIGIKVENELP